MKGTNGASAAAAFSVANADALQNNGPTFTAFSNLAAVNSADNLSVDLGLPFFFGRSIFTAIENKQTPRGTGPYVAF